MQSSKTHHEALKVEPTATQDDFSNMGKKLAKIIIEARKKRNENSFFKKLALDLESISDLRNLHFDTRNKLTPKLT